MPRLGELLVASGAISHAQLEEALRAQVIHGARLGTNLVELGHVELDAIATALARQHRLPPAQRRHFERCDPDVQRRLPQHLAGQHLIVPIGLVADGSGRVLIACRDPISEHARRDVEVAMGLPEGGAILAIAAELRVLYFLERVYGLPRPARFLRVRGPRDRAASRAETWEPRTDEDVGSFAAEPSQYRSFEDTTGQHPSIADLDGDFPRPEVESFEPPSDFRIEETPVEHLVETPAPGSTWRAPGRRPPEPPPLEPPPPLEVEATSADRAVSLDGEDLRRFVETIADGLPGAPRLGRVALRRVAVKSPSSGNVSEAAELARVVAGCDSIPDVARAIRRSETRNRVGDLVVLALRRFAPDLDAALVFVVREDVAFGWKGFSVGVDDLAIEELAIPLDAPTVVAAAAAERRALLIDGEHGTELDRRLWRVLGHPNPGQVACTPVLLSGLPVCLVYGQARSMVAYAELFAALAQATTTALARMLRAAQR